MMDISHHHRAPSTRSSLRCLIAFALTLMALLAFAVCTPSGIAAWEPHFFLSRPLSPMPLGNYANTVVQLGANTTVTPDAAPANTASINVSTSTNFKGKLEGNPTTGVVRVTDAHPAGTYTVTVTGFDGGPTTKTFTLTVMTPPTCSPVTFAAVANFAAGDSPREVAAGDFNRDGRLDLVVANQGSNNLSVLLGNGFGGFADATNFVAGTQPTSVAVGDFNGDGNQDLAATNGNSDNVSVLLGNGTGGFSDATNFVVGSVPESIAVGDFNGDRRQDLATANATTANATSASVSILLGNGAGGFGAATNFITGAGTEFVAVGDFNGDGKQDLATANHTSDNVSVLLGTGAGGFNAAVNFPTGAGPYSVTVGDLDGDGKQDLATSNGSSNDVSILLGIGAGGFSAPTNFGVGFDPELVAMGDFNSDGKQDLAVANRFSASVSLLVGNGTGGFGAATNFFVGSVPTSLAVGDFNGDGRQDLATANFNTDNVSVLLQQCSLPTTFFVGNTSDSGPGSLREAITNANASPGTIDTIAFNFPGSEVRTIRLFSPLSITQPLIIDGYTQPGSRANTMAVGTNAELLIEITGNDGTFSGLNITGGGSTVRGLVINRFGDSGIRLNGNGGNLVEGCFIGTDSAGLNPLGNGVGVAVVSSSSNNIIGGTARAARNIISGNRTAGIKLGDAGMPTAGNNSIPGDYIGTDTTANGPSQNNSILGNNIGTNATGNGPLGNGGNGIFITNATGALIQGNRIAYNTGDASLDTGNGVRIPTPAGGGTPGTRIEITENEIFGNARMGIDLGPTGITDNDPGDLDAGPNFLQNFPVLTSFLPLNTSGLAGKEWVDLKRPELAITAPTTFTVGSQLNSTPNSTFTVHWYFSADAQCTTNQAATAPLYFGRVPNVMTNCNGFASFSFPFAFTSSNTSGVINATATDAQGNTSEFSACIPVTAASPWQPVLTPVQIEEIKAWTIAGRTYAYVKPKFPDAGYRVASWGSLTRTDNTFTANASVEKFNGPSVQSVVTTAQIYDLGPLTNGTYDFNFKTSGTSATILQFTVSSAVPPVNPIDEVGEFVRQQYRDFLNREADMGGEANWIRNITQCNDPEKRPPEQTVEQCILRQRETTSAAFFKSPEFQVTGYFVYRMYKGALGRQPKLSEFTPDARFVGKDIVVGGELSATQINDNKAAFAAMFVNCTDTTKYRCAEFKVIYDGLCNQQYVDKLFQTTGVTASESDRAALVNGLNATPATETRASVLQKVVDGINVISEGNQQFTTLYGQAFYNSELNRAFVQLEYFGYMKRDPDEAGYAFWLGKLNTSGGDFLKAEMVLAFISSPEYRARFGEP